MIKNIQPAGPTKSLLQNLKPLFACTVILLGSVMIACTTPKKTAQHNCQPVTDSARIFIKTNLYALNTRPSMPDMVRNQQLDKWLQNRNYGELACLLNNPDINLKFTGFAFATVLYADSLQKNYAALLQDTTPVQLMYEDGRSGNTSTLGNILTDISTKMREGMTNTRKVPAVDKIIPPFIQQYAAYPDSYKQDSYTGQFANEDTDRPSDYIVQHTYSLKNNKGITARVTSIFILNSQSVITAIKNEKGTYNGDPNKFGSWFNEFGRTLNRRDSVALGF
jgi:hypothetical protein